MPPSRTSMENRRVRAHGAMQDDGTGSAPARRGGAERRRDRCGAGRSMCYKGSAIRLADNILSGERP